MNNFAVQCSRPVLPTYFDHSYCSLISPQKLCFLKPTFASSQCTHAHAHTRALHLYYSHPAVKGGSRACWHHILPTHCENTLTSPAVPTTNSYQCPPASSGVYAVCCSVLAFTQLPQAWMKPHHLYKSWLITNYTLQCFDLCELKLMRWCVVSFSSLIVLPIVLLSLLVSDSRHV